MYYWDMVDATREIFKKHGFQTGGTYQMHKYRTESPESNHADIVAEGVMEGVAAMIQQAALDFLSQEFRGFPKHLVDRDLAERTEELYKKWVAFSERIYGLNHPDAQQAGWEMIIGGEYGDPGLTSFPKLGALHQ